MRGRRARLRVLGAALLVYGVVGIVIFAIVALNVVRPLDRARKLADSVDSDRQAVVASLGQAETTIREMSTGVGRLDTSLGDAKTAIDQATTISHSLAQSMFSLRDAMSLSILGAQPLIGLAGSFDTSGQNLDTLGNDVAAIGIALEANQGDVRVTTANLVALAESVHTLTQTVANGPQLGIRPHTIDAIRLAIYAVAAWMVLLAIGCVLIGLYMVNISRQHAPLADTTTTRTTTTTTATAVPANPSPYSTTSTRSESETSNSD